MRVQKWQDWQAFWQAPLGQALFAAEVRQLQPLLEEARGYHLLWLGSTPAGTLLQQSSIRHCIEWRPDAVLAEQKSCLIADPAALPLPDACMDRVIVQHSLELVARPHALLKEAARVTLAKGELIIIGFNPLSLWGLVRLLPDWMHSRAHLLLGEADLISPFKLNDWLTFLDFKCEVSQAFFHRPPCNSAALLKRFQGLDQRLENRNLPLAGVYLLRVTPRIGSPLRPPPVWQKASWLPLQPANAPTRTGVN